MNQKKATTKELSHHQMNRSSSIREGSKIRLLFFWLFLADVLFLPFPSFVPTSYSALAMPLWLMFEASHLRISSQIFKIIIGLFFVLTSFAFAYLNKQLESYIVVSNVINSGIVIYMMLAYIALSSSVQDKKGFILLSLKIYLAFTFSLAIIFLYSPPLYFSLRSFWTISNNLIEVDGLNSLVRFTGTLSDPNNMATIANSILCFIIFRDSRSILLNTSMCFSVGIIVACSMSVTGLLSFAIVTVAYYGSINLNKSKSINLVLRFVTIVAICALTYLLFQFVRDAVIIQLALERAANSTIDSRLLRWQIVFDIEKVASSILLGDGGTIFWNGVAHKPHNGILHLFFNYGLILSLIFISIFLRARRPFDWRASFFLVPLFIGFIVNVGIYEPRFAGIWALLIASYHFSSYDKKIRF